MSSPKAVLKSVGPKLVPFFKTVAIYFVLFIPDDSPSWFACLIKCLPVISLCIFVLLHGISLGDEYRYSRWILAGLVFSCIGDAFLIDLKQNLIIGMAFFSGAHFAYLCAFGFRPINLYLGAVCYCSALGMYLLVLPKLNGVMHLAGPIYLLLITTMVWRAIAPVHLFHDLWKWTELCRCAGSIMFFISDMTIAINTFLTPVPYGQAIIMTTYYAAQLGIALSVVDSMGGHIHPNYSAGGKDDRDVISRKDLSSKLPTGRETLSNRKHYKL